MSESFLNGKVTLLRGDCLELLPTLAENSIDSCVTDPPYHLTSIVKRFGKSNLERNPDTLPASAGTRYNRLARGFMGKQWDGGNIAFRPEVWAEVWRVLKPGAHLLAFSGTRTYHRMACAIEDAGFEIRDQIGWCYGSGFPKSHDVSKGIDRMAGATRTVTGKDANYGKSRLEDGKTTFGDYAGEWEITSPATEAAIQWQGWGTALKPAWEPIVLARKPLSESSIAANVLRHGCGALNIDACRIESTDSQLAEKYHSNRNNNRPRNNAIYGGDSRPRNAGAIEPHPQGRWPANLIHDGSEEVVRGFPETGAATASANRNGKDVGDVFSLNRSADQVRGHDDAGGSAARFFASFPITDEDRKWQRGRESKTEPARNAGECLSLQSEAAASVLSNAVAMSGGLLTLQKQSYRAPSTNVTADELDEISTLITTTIQNIVLSVSLEQRREKHSLSHGLVSIAAVRKPTGTITITINLSKSNGSVDPVTFDCIETREAVGGQGFAKRYHYTAKADADDRLGSRHPTIKPLDLVQYLCRLVTQRGGVILDPFAGTGTAGEAGWREGCRVVLVEREPEYQADIVKRMELCRSGPDARRAASVKQLPLDDLPMFRRGT